MLKPLIFVFLLAAVMTQSPRIATSASGNRPTKQDFGLESISEELPIVEPEDPPPFMDSQFRFMAPKPAPMRPVIPQAQAKKKSAVKYPIPQAFKAPEPPKKEVYKKEPQIQKAVKAPPRRVKPNLHKRTHWKNDTRSALRQANVTETVLKKHVLNLMQQSLYHTQDGNMKQVEAMAVKYGKVKQYRMAFIVLQMEEIKKEMYMMYFYFVHYYDAGVAKDQKNVTVDSTCVVPGCTASSEHNPNNRIFHVLPKEPHMCAQWLEAIGLHKYADNLKRKKASYRVCSDHFDESSYETKLILRKTAVPTSKPLRSNKPVIGGSNAHPVGMASGDEAIRTEHIVELDEHALRVEICRRAELEASMAAPEPSSTEEFLKYSHKFLDSKTLKLITCQMLMKKSDKWKFPIKYRLFCLALYYHNPRAYGFLQEFMKLLPVAKLQNTHLNVNSGHVSPRCLQILKSMVSQMKTTDRCCVVGIASIVLKKHIYYDIRNDKIQGLHQVAFEQSRNPAKKAYALVVRGLLSDWQMPVAFALFHNSDVGALQQWTDSVIRILMLNGLDIRAFVSNQGESLRRSSDKNAFVLMNKTIYNIFDVRYLFQRIRHCLMRFDMLVPSEGVASWDHILKFYKAEKKLQTNLAPGLTRVHLLPDDDENQSKSAELASQLFSKTVASAMNAFIGLKHLDPCADATVNLINTISDLLDLLNLDTLEHNSPVSKNSIEELSKAFEYFDTVRRVTKSVSVRYAKIEPVVALTLTIKSILDLRRDLSENGSSHLLTKSLNLQFVEDCFREICAHDKKRKKKSRPVTSIEFIRGFNNSFLDNFIKNARRNSSNNLKSSLSKLHKYLTVSTDKNDPLLDLESKNKSLLIDHIEHKIILPNQMVSRFLAGYLMTKALETHRCDKLVKYLNPSDTVTYSFIDCHYLDMKLPIEFVLFVVKLEHEFINVFRQEFTPRDVGATAMKAMSHLVILPCRCFPLFVIKKLFIRIRIYNLVKDINKQLEIVDVFKINTYDL